MADSTCHNDQFRIDPINILIALLLSIAAGRSVQGDQAAVSAVLFPHILMALMQLRR